MNTIKLKKKDGGELILYNQMPYKYCLFVDKNKDVLFLISIKSCNKMFRLNETFDSAFNKIKNLNKYNYFIFGDEDCGTVTNDFSYYETDKDGNKFIYMNEIDIVPCVPNKND